MDHTGLGPGPDGAPPPQPDAGNHDAASADQGRDQPAADQGRDQPTATDATGGTGGSPGMDAADAADAADAGAMCPSGTHPCSSGCVADDSTSGCGRSCTACAAPPDSTATCNGTACGFRCNDGFHPCGEGCASNASPATCGATSCEPCPVPSHGHATCDGTACGFACDGLYVPEGGACVLSCDGACDSVATIVDVAEGGRFMGATSGGSASAGSCGGGSAPEAIYRLTLTETSDVFITTHGTGFDTVLVLRRGGCCGAEVACNDNADGRMTSVLAQRGLQPGTYYVFVDGASPTAMGEFTLDVNVTPASSGEADACGNPRRLGAVPLAGNTCGLRADYEPMTSCTAGTPTGNDAVYYFVLDEPTTVTVDTCTNTCFDSIIYVRDTCSAQLSQRICADDTCQGTNCALTGAMQSSATLFNLPAGIHYVFVDVFGGTTPDCGAFTLTPAGIPP